MFARYSDLLVENVYTPPVFSAPRLEATNSKT